VILRNGGAVLDSWAFDDEGTAVLCIARTHSPHYRVTLYLCSVGYPQHSAARSTFRLTFSDFTGSASLLFWAPAKRLLHGLWAQTFCQENTEFVTSEVTSISSAVSTPTQEPHTRSK
jgi:hypothetical protein